MNQATRSLLLLFATALFLFQSPLPLSAADDQETELKRKAAEVERLKRELEKSQTELQRLREDNERLRRQKAAAPAAVEAVPEPSKPLATLPTLQPEEVVDARDLVLYYKADPAGADARFRNKTFRIQGIVQGFSTKLFIRDYEVLLDSPDRQIKVVCSFHYVDRYQAVFTTRRGQELSARLGESKSLTPLLKVGDQLIIQGRCGGLRESYLEFTRCETVK